jgi:hypothetical protein
MKVHPSDAKVRREKDRDDYIKDFANGVIAAIFAVKPGIRPIVRYGTPPLWPYRYVPWY